MVPEQTIFLEPTLATPWKHEAESAHASCGEPFSVSHKKCVVYVAGAELPLVSQIARTLRGRDDCDVVTTPRLVDAWKSNRAQRNAILITRFPFVSIEDDVLARSLREFHGGEYCVLLAVAQDDSAQSLARVNAYPIDDLLVAPMSESQLFARLEIAIRRVKDLQERKQSSLALHSRTRYEKMLVNISTEFINITPKGLTGSIQTALQLIGEFTHADRAYVSFLDTEGTTVEYPFEWCAPGIDSHVNVLKGEPRSSYEWFLRQYVEHRMINVPDISMIPEDAVAERTLMRQQGIQSLICLPLMSETKIIGYFGLDSVRNPRIWPEDVITLLTITGQIFSNAWERCRSESRRAEIETQMQHAQKLESLGVLAGGIAHDFNNLLVGILANAGLALLDMPRNSNAFSRVAQIELAAQRAGELTNQMLAYAGKGRFVLHRLDLSDIVREMAHLLESAIPKKVKLQFNFEADLPPMEADPAQVRQVIMNLITNAADAMKAVEGSITVNTGLVVADRGYLSTMYIDDSLDPDTYIFLEVSDTGCGMDAETRARIFDPFFTTKFSGHGLGLAAVLGIVRAHRGSIKVTSELGKGTTFRVIFPCLRREINDVHSTNMAGEKKLAAKTLEATVLVVDDEDMVRDVAQMVLENAGCTVLAARDAVDAIGIFTAWHADIDVVLLDLSMPGLGGDEVCRELKRINPDVRVVLSSGYSEDDATRCFGAMALAGFIQKPYRAIELTEKIATILGA